jgi:hypothetical protein
VGRHLGRLMDLAVLESEDISQHFHPVCDERMVELIGLHGSLQSAIGSFDTSLRLRMIWPAMHDVSAPTTTLLLHEFIGELCAVVRVQQCGMAEVLVHSPHKLSNTGSSLVWNCLSPSTFAGVVDHVSDVAHFPTLTSRAAHPRLLVHQVQHVPLADLVRSDGLRDFLIAGLLALALTPSTMLTEETDKMTRNVTELLRDGSVAISQMSAFTVDLVQNQSCEACWNDSETVLASAGVGTSS